MATKKPTPSATASTSATKEPSLAAKAPNPSTVTLKQLAPALADTNGLTKQQSGAVLSSLVAIVTTRLKAGDKVRLTGLGILRCATARPAPAAIRQPASRSRSRPAGRSSSALPKNSRTPSDAKCPHPC